MASMPLKVNLATASSHSANYRPELVLVDAPEDVGSRWTGEFQKTCPTQNRNQWLKLELEKLSIVKTITFGKSIRAHPCNIDQFKVYGSTEDSNDMPLLLYASLKNDEIPQTFSLKHVTDDGIIFPIRFVKIVPLTPFHQTYNMSIWHVALRGIDDPSVVDMINHEYSNFRESLVMRLILKHLRRRNSSAYSSLLAETGIVIENPLISSLYETLVVEGTHAKAEAIFAECINANLVDLQGPHSRSRSSWHRISDTDAEGNIPSPRGGHFAVLDRSRGMMYIFGGWDGLKELDDLWVYSIPSGQWARLSANVAAEGGPSARCCGAAVIEEKTGDIFFLGRYIGREHTTSPAPKDDSFARAAMAGTVTRALQEGATNITQPIVAGRVGENLRRSGNTVDTFQDARVEAHSASNSRSFKSDFWRFSTRGTKEGKWKLLNSDTKKDGGIELAHDLAMTINNEDGVIYAFGGEIQGDRKEGARHYASFCTYSIGTRKWTRVFGDSAEEASSLNRSIPSRDRHSMAFDRDTKRVFVVGGERAGRSFDSLWTFDVTSGQVAEMTTPEDMAHPSSVQMLRANFDDQSREIFATPELGSSPSSRNRSLDGNHITLWVYSIDSNIWIPILEPSRASARSSMHSLQPSETDYDSFVHDSDREPRPRLGHSVVYDSSRRMFLVFGGNPGHGGRLNDLWSFSLDRPSAEDILRKAKLQIRSQKFKEMCETSSSLTALGYLQSNVSSAVNHNDEEESAAFRHLLSALLSRPSSPTTRDDDSPDFRRHSERMGTADVDMSGGVNVSKSEPDSNTSHNGSGNSDATRRLHSDRLAVFDKLMTFINPLAKQPRADLIELVRTEL